MSPRHSFRIHRRDWLKLACASCFLPNSLRAQEPADDLAAIAAHGQKVGLPAFERTQTAHFLAIGDATSAFRAAALNACEKMADDYLNHMQVKGFTHLAFPKKRMTVVTLGDSNSYAAYTGDPADLVIGGHYERDTNRLVMFDFRGNRNVGAAAERINSFVLFHETSHQLTFNIGLLNPKGDVPLCIAEGMAAYGEVWRPERRGFVGQINKDRLGVLPASTKALRDAWIPLPTLLKDDEQLRDKATQQLAYAESWALIHAHLKNPDRTPKLRAYLTEIFKRDDASRRLEDAEKHLGDLTKLDAALRSYIRKPIGM
jgi:hypothetical protein